MKRFIIIANTDKDINLSLSRRITEYLESKDASAVIVSDVTEKCSEEYISADVAKRPEAVIVLGGDGTMVRAARGIGHYNLPLIVINLGT